MSGRLIYKNKKLLKRHWIQISFINKIWTIVDFTTRTYINQVTPKSIITSYCISQLESILMCGWLCPLYKSCWPCVNYIINMSDVWGSYDDLYMLSSSLWYTLRKTIHGITLHVCKTIFMSSFVILKPTVIQNSHQILLVLLVCVNLNEHVFFFFSCCNSLTPYVCLLHTVN